MPRVVLALSIAIVAAACDSRPADGATSRVRSAAPDAGADRADAGGERETRSRRRDGTRVAEMRAFAADLVADRLCKSLDGRFHRLWSKPGGVILGVLWIERCRATARGGEVSFALGGLGWRWVQRESEKLAADFAVTDYARFAYDVEARADVDIAYTSANHMMTIWADLIGSPAISIDALGKIDVDAESVWGDIIGNAGALAGQSPEDRATDTFVAEARQKAAGKLGKGMTASINLCTGEIATERGQLPAGRRVKPNGKKPVGKPARVALFERGLQLSGPAKIRRGTRLDVKVIEGGSVRAAIVCESEAAKLATAFARGTALPTVGVVAARTVVGSGRLDVVRAPCQRGVLAFTGVSEGRTEIEYRLTGVRSDRKPYLDCKRQ